MNFKKLFSGVIPILTCALALIAPVKAQPQNTSICEQAFMITKTAEKFHYAPKAVDDKFSEIVFNKFINSLDAYGFYFTKDEIQQLNSYKHKLDDEILNKECTFLSKTTALYKRKLSITDSIINNLKPEKINFSINESITLDKEKGYPSTAEMTNKWRKRLKLQILYAYFSENDSGGSQTPPSDEVINELKNKIIERIGCRIKSKLDKTNDLDKFVGEKFLKAVSSAYDPHTNYFSVGEMDEYDMHLAKEAYSFGFEITSNNNDETQIYKILPGSPAWKSNLLNEGDIILGIKTQTGYKNLSCLNIKDVRQLIASEGIKEASFHIKKQNGKEIQVTLHKEKTEVEENVIKSFILEGKSKVGYIYLPSFYSDLDNIANAYANKGCSNDVAKELIKLKREGIKGLILDLRNNGGGYMHEAVALAGIFVNFGAITIVDARGEEPVTVKDINRGTIFTDPLVVLVNSFSASASELFAAAIQDYNRGIIVGSTSYGKSTSQEILPVDAYKLAANSQTNPVGFLKVTQGKFFRVNGTSHQKTGIVPDIRLPQVLDAIETGEKTYTTALESSEINKKTYYYPLAALPIEKIRENSKFRTEKDSGFALIREKGEKLAAINERKAIPVNFKSFKEYYELNISQLDFENSNYNTDSTYLVKNPSYMFIHGGNEKKINEDSKTKIQKDIYIRESYLILSDLINMK